MRNIFLLSILLTHHRDTETQRHTKGSLCLSASVVRYIKQLGKGN